jgi:hypothetical protein
MSQAGTLRTLDARLMLAFAGVGLADVGVYVSKDTMTTVDPCHAYIDRDVQTLGDSGQVVGQKTHATFLFAEVMPQSGGVFTVGAESWKLDKELSRDESRTRWAVTSNG